MSEKPKESYEHIEAYDEEIAQLQNRLRDLMDRRRFFYRKIVEEDMATRRRLMNRLGEDDSKDNP